MSTTALSHLPVKVLKQMLAARDAAQHGTREQLVERLESGQQGKKKPGPKGKPSDTSIKQANVKDEIEFYKKERPRLIAAGMKDKKKQDEELKRRWQKKIGQASPKPKVTFAKPAAKKAAPISYATLSLSTMMRVASLRAAPPKPSSRSAHHGSSNSARMARVACI